MFGYFYQQTEYSMLSNLMKLDKFVLKAKEYGYDFLTITDNNLHGAFKFYELCEKNKIKPIIGLYISIEFDNFIENVLLYALNNKGFSNLVKISTLEKTNTNNKISYKEIIDYTEGIVLITSGKESKLHELIKSNMENAYNFFLKIKSVFPNIYFGIEKNNRFSFYLNFIHKYNINSVIISKTSLLEPDDLPALNLLLKVNKKENRVTGSHLKTKEEFINEYKDYNFLIESTNNLAKKINIKIDYGKLLMPIFPSNKNITSHEYLEALAFAGLKKRGKIKESNLYIERLKYELDVINKMGFSDYFLIVWDAIRFAKTNDIMIGPGRGSAAGSLVSYSLGITEVDPIKYNLFFERFLNYGRKNMPDIDIDIQDDKRDKVVEYVKNKYGRNHVCDIVTFQEFQSKGAIRDIGKAMGFKINEIDEVVKNIENKDNLEYLAHKNNRISELLKIISKIEGFPRQKGSHASGIILSNQDLFGLIPLQTGINDLEQSQYEGDDLEKIGLLKIDFLRLKNLTTIKKILALIETHLNIKLNINQLPLNDKKTYNVFKSADTMGIFQFENIGMRRVMAKMKPESFLDISHLIAIYRPGPMDNIDDFLRRRKEKRTDFFINELEPILSETYGVIIYQEQIMQIVKEYANYTLEESDLLRKSMSKKMANLMDNDKEHFIKKSIENNKPEEEANKLYELLLKFANYGFNKSHSVAYALVSYQLAYFKANYTIYFMCSILNNLVDNNIRIKEYIDNCKKYNIEVLRVDINRSGSEYLIEENAIRMPFRAVKGIGFQSAEAIIKNRENGYLSYQDFINKVDLEQNIIENLIFAGAFDSFKKETKKNMVTLNNKSKIKYANLVNDLIVDETEFDISYIKRKELEVLGFNMDYNPLYKYIRKYYQKHKINPCFISELRDNLNKKVTIISYILDVTLYEKSPNNRKFISFTDGYLSFNFYASEESKISKNDILLITCIPVLKDNKVYINIIKLEKIN